MTLLNDRDLLEQFVTGKVTLAANQNLRIEPALKMTQLLTKKGTLLAKLDRSAQPAIAIVKQGSEYWSGLHQLLSEQGFILGRETTTRLPGESGFLRYEAQPIPIGYQMRCTEVKTLWKVWSDAALPYHRHQIRLELLLLTRDLWMPIQEMTWQRGIVFIKTLITAARLQDSDYVVWLQKNPPC